jgi:hypothetical protein
MNKLTYAGIATLACLLFNSLSAAAQTPLNSNAQQALEWLQCSQQLANGQIGTGGNPIARSSEVALSLAAAGQPATAMKHGRVSLASYLSAVSTTDVGTNGELLLARASQPDTGSAAAVVAQLDGSKSSTGVTAGEYGGDIYSDALAVLGLRADDQVVGSDSIAFLKSQQKADGGWSFDNADQYGTDSNTTATVIQALMAAGVDTHDSVINNGFTYLKSVFAQGGFGDTPGAGPDPNSDELAIQAILAAGKEADAAWQSMLTQAFTYLADQQLRAGNDRGAIASSFSKLFATTSAPAAFLKRPLTTRGISELQLPLLPCPASTSSSASASPTAAPKSPASTTRLAQTGSSRPPGLPIAPLVGIVLLATGLSLLEGKRRRRLDH